jgi:hypothetical protein
LTVISQTTPPAGTSSTICDVVASRI